MCLSNFYKIIATTKSKLLFNSPEDKVYYEMLTQFKQLHGKSLTCSISYAWICEGDEPRKKHDQKEWIEKFACHLEWAGFKVTLDRWDNMNSGDIDGFVTKLASKDRVFLIGSALLRAKSTQTHRVVCDEIKAITARIEHEGHYFLFPIVKEDEHSVAFPDYIPREAATDMRRRNEYPERLIEMLMKSFSIDRHHYAYQQISEIKAQLISNIALLIKRKKSQINQICQKMTHEEHSEKPLLDREMRRLKASIYKKYLGAEGITELKKLFNLRSLPEAIVMRHDYLNQLDEYLPNKGTDQLKIVGVTGMGGMGKSIISLNYGLKNRNAYSYVYFIDAHDRQSLIEGYRALAIRIGFECHASSSEDVINITKQFLETFPGWLIILDSIDSPYDMNHLLPESGGHILVTSRVSNWEHYIRVHKFSSAEAIQFITGFGIKGNPEELATFSDLLGFIPLALKQACSYIRETPGLKLNRYCELFQEKRKMLWKCEERPRDYHSSIAVTWRITLEKIKSQPLLLEIIQMISYVNPNFIQERFWGFMLKERLGKIEFELEVLNISRELFKYGLIDSKEGSFTVHRLFQYVVHDSTSEKEKNDAQSRLINILSQGLEAKDVALDSTIHIRALAELMGLGNPNIVFISTLLSKAAMVLYEYSQSVEAVWFANKSIFFHQENIEAYAYLGRIYNRLWGGIDKNKKFASLARMTLEKAYAINPNNSLVLANLAFNMVTETPELAIEYARKAISIDPENDTGYNALALALEKRGVSEAEDVFREGLKKCPNSCILLINFANRKRREQDYESAIFFLRKVLSINPYFDLAYQHLQINYHTLKRIHESEEISQEYCLRFSERNKGFFCDEYDKFLTGFFHQKLSSAKECDVEVVVDEVMSKYPEHFFEHIGDALLVRNVHDQQTLSVGRYVLTKTVSDKARAEVLSAMAQASLYAEPIQSEMAIIFAKKAMELIDAIETKNKWRIYFCLANAYNAADQHKNALEVCHLFQELKLLAPRSELCKVFIIAITNFMTEGNISFEKMILEIEKWESNYNLSKDSVFQTCKAKSLGRLYLLRGNFEKSYELNRLVIQEFFADSMAYINIGLSCNGLKKYTEAIPHFQKAQDLFSHCISNPYLIYLGWGDALEGLGQFEAAKAKYIEGLKLFPNEIALKVKLSILQLKNSSTRQFLLSVGVVIISISLYKIIKNLQDIRSWFALFLGMTIVYHTSWFKTSIRT